MYCVSRNLCCYKDHFVDFGATILADDVYTETLSGLDEREYRIDAVETIIRALHLNQLVVTCGSCGITQSEVFMRRCSSQHFRFLRILVDLE